MRAANKNKVAKVAIDARHWWWNLPEAAGCGRIERQEALLAEIEATERKLRALRRQAQEAEKEIVRLALENWTAEEIEAAQR